MDGTGISLPLDNSFIHTGHGSIGGGKTWGSPSAIDPVYLNNPMTPPDLLGIQPQRTRSLKMNTLKSGKGQFSYRRLPTDKVSGGTSSLERKPTRQAPVRPPPPTASSIGQLIDLSSPPRLQKKDQPFQEKAIRHAQSEISLLDLPNFEEAVNAMWNDGSEDIRSVSPDPFDTSRAFQPDWQAEKPFEPRDWPINHDSSPAKNLAQPFMDISSQKGSYNMNSTDLLYDNSRKEPTSSYATYQNSVAMWPTSDAHSRINPQDGSTRADEAKFSEVNVDHRFQSQATGSAVATLPPPVSINLQDRTSPVLQGTFMDELQKALEKRSNIPKLEPPGSKNLSFHNHWESKDTNMKTVQSHSYSLTPSLPAFNNVNQYASPSQVCEAKNEELNKKNLELINQISKMRNNPESRNSMYASCSSVAFKEAEYNNLPAMSEPSFTSGNSLSENVQKDKYAVFSQYGNLDHSYSTVPNSNQGSPSNAPFNYSERNDAGPSFSTATYNNIEAAGAYGGTRSSIYSNTEGDLSEQISQMWLSSQGLSKDTIKKHNELVAESKKMAVRNLYDPVEANYQRINYAPSNLMGEEAVRQLMLTVEGAEEQECRSALQSCGYDLKVALKNIKLNRLLRLGIASRDDCLNELERCNWDIVMAASRLLDREKT